jgi:hypothetical protein
MRRSIGMIALSVLGAALMLGSVAITPMRVNAAEARTVTLYADPNTGQVFYKPCRRCVRLGDYVPAGSTEEIERKVELRTQQQLDADRAAMQADIANRAAQQQQWNAEMAKQVSTIQPFAQEFGDRWFKKISIGTLVYGDYGYFPHTGFGPQFLTQQNWPGPGNNSFSAFNITRAYLDFKFTPIDDISMRVTPNIYTQIGTATADTVGKSSSYASTLDGDLGFRLKYAYLDYNTFFQKVLKVGALHDDKITFGQEPNPLVDWEENLWGFRYTALTPWNYLSLASTQVGVSMKGPIKVNETQYADYDFGVFNDASFHAQEESAYKQVMGRVTINPLGAHSRYDSLGLTGFYDYAYSQKCTPDENGPSGGNTTCAHIARAAALLHYTAEKWGIIGEWDYGHNAFGTNNLFSGSGPNTAAPSSFIRWNKMAGLILNNGNGEGSAGQAVQMGWDFLGHADVPHTPFTIFGLWQQFLPNTRLDHDPLDFRRYDLGVQWLVNKYLRVAVDYQGINYYHGQFSLPAGFFGPKSKEFDDAVPRDTQAFFLHLEFRY